MDQLKLARRTFLKQAGIGLIATKVSQACASSTSTMPIKPTIVTLGTFTLPKLPYAENALEPFVSSKTMSFHYGKHHAGYVNKLNELSIGTPFETKSLEEIIVECKDNPNLFNAAAQVWNHTFFWNSLKPQGLKAPTGKLSSAIKTQWKTHAAFQEEYISKATSLFGSGWTWLVADQQKKLSIVQSKDAENPMTLGLTPLLTLDVWEHAYYLDYQNKRKDYLTAIVTHLTNWEFAQSRFDSLK